MLLALFIINCLFFYNFGKKKGFNQLEVYWLLYFTLFLYFLFQKNIIMIIFFLLNSHTQKIIIFFSSIIKNYFYSDTNKFNNLRIISQNLFPYIPLHNIKQEIIICNYPSNYIEYFVPPLFSENLVLLIHQPAIKIVKHIWGSTHLIGVSKNSYENIKKQIKYKIQNNQTIFVYFERDYYKRTHQDNISDIRKGIFYIAHELKIPIRMLKLNHLEHFCGIEFNKIEYSISESMIIQDVESTIQKVKRFYN